MHNEKEQEMTSPVSHSQAVQSAIQGEEFIDDDLDSQTLGNARPENPLPTLLWVPPAGTGQLRARTKPRQTVALCPLRLMGE